MNKKIIVAFTSFLILAMMMTPLAIAKPWNSRNNPKFETFSTSFIPNTATIIAAVANPEWVNPNKVITSWVEEPMIAYTLTVDGVDYYLETDFEYTGVATVTAIGAPFTAVNFGILNGDKHTGFRVDYVLDFSAVTGGIEGKLYMLAIAPQGGAFTPGNLQITSTKGTGDLQNVVIKATGGGGPTHIGIVSGWPE